MGKSEALAKLRANRDLQGKIAPAPKRIKIEKKDQVKSFVDAGVTKNSNFWDLDTLSLEESHVAKTTRAQMKKKGIAENSLLSDSHAALKALDNLPTEVNLNHLESLLEKEVVKLFLAGFCQVSRSSLLLRVALHSLSILISPL